MCALNRFVFGSKLLRPLILAIVIAAIAATAHSFYRAPFYFEINLDQSIAGKAQLYYDFGPGFREEDSTATRVQPGHQTYRFPLQAGTYHALRFDPSDKSGNQIKLSGARLTDGAGRTISTFSSSAFSPRQDIEQFHASGDTCDFQTSAKGNDSILSIKLDGPMSLQADGAINWRQGAWDFVKWLLIAFVGIFLLEVVVRRASRPVVHGLGQGWRWAVSRPLQAVFVVALSAAVLSCYPVVFCGKSFVSPNIVGSAMLYPTPPFLPGYEDADLELPKGSDTGAMLWQNLPYSFIQSRALWRDHELPLWNRYNSAGTPLLAQGLSMFGDPLHNIVLLGRGAAWAWDIKFVLAKVLFCFALGLLVLRTAKNLPAALVLAASSAFIGFFSYRFDHPAYFSSCYAPWILLAWVEIARSVTSRSFLGWACVLLVSSCAEINSGGVKEGYMLLCAMHASGLLIYLFGTETPARWKKLRYLFCFGASFFLLTAPFWLPFVDTLGNSFTVYNVTPSFQIQPSLILGFFDDIFYRAVNSQGEVFNPSTNFLILFGILAVLPRLRSLVRDRVFLAVVLGAFPPFALAFGIVPPSLISKIPVLKNVGHLDNTFSCALIIQAVIIAGFGLSHLDRRIRSRTWSWDYTVIVSAFAALVSLYLGFTHAAQRPPDAFTPIGASVTLNFAFYVYAFSLITGLLLLPFVARRWSLATYSKGIFIVFIVTACVLFHWRFALHLKSGIEAVDDIVSNPGVRANFKAHSRAVEWLRKTPETARVVGFDDTFFSGYNGISGLESITGTDPLENIYYRNLILSGGVSLQWMWRWVVDRDSWDKMLPLYNLLNIRYFLDSRTSDVHLPNLSKVTTLDLAVYENRSAWPRAFFADRVMAYDSTPQFIAALAKSKDHPFAAIEGVDRTALAPALFVPSPEGVRAVAARDYHLTSNTTTFTIDAPDAGVAVLTEAFLPDDFIVRINGAATGYFRVNHAFRGVLIPRAGAYTISYCYWPRRFTLSLLMAGGGALILGAAAIALLRAKRDDQPSSPWSSVTAWL